MNEKLFCQRCGEKLNNKTFVWLECNFTDAKYYAPGQVPEDESQGLFAFGKACAKAVLANDGENVRIRSRLRVRR